MYIDHDIIVECNCGCNYLRISQVKEEKGMGEVYISQLIPSFYALQQPGWTKFTEMLKAFWCFLSGKEYYLYDVVLVDKEQIIAFKKAVAELDENVYYNLP